jgi:two-component sensor histidine kinase
MSLVEFSSRKAADGVFITDELLRRPPKKTDYLQEKVALQDLALQMADYPAEVLPHLVDLAIEICGGISGGISLYEDDPAPGVFRWHYLRGDLEKFTGETTPRDFSPCGVTLDLRTPVLAEHPERYYTWLEEAGIALPECLLVPLYVGSGEPLGTLWIVSPTQGHFDSGHARIMTELAAFAGMALRMVRTEDRLQQAFAKQEQLMVEQVTLTGEMSHRVQNLFAIFNGMVRVSARSAATPGEMSEILSGRLVALAAAHVIVRRTFDDKGVASQGAELRELVPTILRPYDSADASGAARFKIGGPPVRLGDRATNGFALFLHEFATNAAKYGALKAATGSVQVNWTHEGRFLVLTWDEQGGPAIHGEPTKQGFGSALATNTVIGQLGGTLVYDWRTTGLLVTISVPLAKLSD